MAGATAVATRGYLGTTVEARVRPYASALAVLDITSTRAEPDQAPPARDEDGMAHITLEGAAGIAPSASTRAREEIQPAVVACDRVGAVGESPSDQEIGVSTPELHFNHPVATLAERLQVGKFVSHSVFIKEVERGLVVDRERIRGKATALAGVPVPQTSLRADAFPISTTVFTVAPEPRRAGGTCPVVSASPCCIALTAAEGPCANRRRDAFDLALACVALDSDATASLSYAMDALPSAIAPESAEVPLRDGRHVWLGQIALATLLARQGDHVHSLQLVEH